MNDNNPGSAGRWPAPATPDQHAGVETTRSISASAEYGLVVRKDALRIRGVTVDALLRALEASQALDEDDHLMSFGPSFGEEALLDYIRRLEALGLHYVTDFCAIHVDLPNWCSLRVSMAHQTDLA